MAQRPDPSPDVPMSAADLAEVRRSFTMLSTDWLRHTYTDARYCDERSLKRKAENRISAAL